MDDNLDYDTSDVMIRFTEGDQDKLNDELADEANNNIKQYSKKGFLIDGEIAMKDFTYFPAWKGHFEGEGGDEIRQFLNSIADAVDVGEEALEEATAESEAAEAA